ncbi:MAG: class I SAM-dependent methyltransferase [Myxococcota bacterium]
MSARPHASGRVPALLERAWRARQALLPPNTSIYRLAHEVGDGLAGLVVDAYGPVAMAQAYEETWRARLPDVAEALMRLGFRSVRAVVRGTSGAPTGSELRVGEPLPEELTAHEQGLGFQIRPADSSISVGLFPDARAVRARVSLLSRGKDVLNLFAYAGGYTVAALAGGAVHVDQVDAAPKTAPWSARNVALNGFSPRDCRFIVDDALAFTAKVVRQGRRYGVVVADIPTFGRSSKGRHSLAPASGKGATRGLVDAVVVSLQATDSGGRLVLGVNARSVDATAAWGSVVTAAEEADVTPVLEEIMGPGPDFPHAPEHPELRHLKVLQVRVER